MIKKLAGIIVLSSLPFLALSQVSQTNKTTARPDIPGTFVLELGLNRDNGGPNDFSIGVWGSRTVNIYYQYEFRILKSPFSFVPGIGVALERYKFKNEYTLGYTSNTSSELILIPPADAAVPGIKKSMLITNYVEVPMELRYTINPEDPSRSFKVAFGGRIGYLFDSFAKVNYKENSQVKKFKD
ncbi:MAG: hypothetical protein C0490_27950, partial [Marivirga sp.]|nr:hypothetical protein [Marivirga sp.]